MPAPAPSLHHCTDVHFLRLPAPRSMMARCRHCSHFHTLAHLLQSGFLVPRLSALVSQCSWLYHCWLELELVWALAANLVPRVRALLLSRLRRSYSGNKVSNMTPWHMLLDKAKSYRNVVMTVTHRSAKRSSSSSSGSVMLDVSESVDLVFSDDNSP